MKSEQHHWWPICVSKHWADSNGLTNWLSPDGNIKRIPPAKLGKIGNGHHIKLSRLAGETSPWDESFEKAFDIADTYFPTVISWLESLTRKEHISCNLQDRYLSQPCTDEQLCKLTECVVSLAVRSPRNREASVALAEKLRGKISPAERNALIGLNMRDSQRIISDNIGARGKFAILFSSGKEFIFGDGFFHNVTAVTNPPHSPMILAPITPTISVIVSRPNSYSTNPPLSTIILNDQEVDICNQAIQVYSRNMLFFKSEKPELTEEFTCNQHRIYNHPNNPIENLIRSIPGVLSRDSIFDSLLLN